MASPPRILPDPNTCRPAERTHVEMADDRTAHGRFRDAVVRQHRCLPFRAGRPVASHRRENERQHPLLAPVPHYTSYDGGDVVDAAAADADGDARSGLYARRKSRPAELPLNFSRNVRNAVVGETLSGQQQAWKSHHHPILPAW